MKHIICSILSALLCAATSGFAADDEGKVVAVSRDSITIGRKHPKSYTVTATTAISVNGRGAAIPAIRNGMRASVGAQGNIATSINARDASSLKGASLK